MVKSNEGVRQAAIDQIVRLRDLRSDKRNIEEMISGVQKEAIDFLKRLGQKSIGFDDPLDGKVKITGTLVTATSLVFDEAKLKKRIGSAKWNRITRRVLDTTLLEAAVAQGLITPQTVAACVSEEPKTPYIRITEKH